MKKLILLSNFLLISAIALAQNGTIGGTIFSEKKALEGAIVSLLKKDSSFVKATITDEKGNFDFSNLKQNTYFITVSNVGYKSYKTEIIEISENKLNLQLPQIELITSSNELAEVTVKAKKPFVEKKIDRTVINPEALIGNAGTTSLDVLEKAPGILVDVNGNISLKGKAGVVVFIDDKPTYLAASDLANYLRSLPSGSIESIEIMTNPPAKYEAAGNAGIINIKLKRNKTKGLNGGLSVSYGQGRYLRSNNSFNINYRINKVNYFANLGANQNNSYQDLTINRKYFKPTGALNTGFTQNSYIKKQNGGVNLKLGFDYYLNKKATFGFVLSGLRNPSTGLTTNNAKITNENNILTSLNEAVNPTKRVFSNASINFNYAYKFDSTGKEITANADKINYNSDMTQSLVSKTLSPERTFINGSTLGSKLPSDIAINTFKIDYVNPLNDGQKMEFGVKTSFISTSNIADFYDVLNNEQKPNYEFSNNFKYKENINAAYANWSKEGKRFSIQAGLRFENTQIKGNQLGNIVVKDSTFTRNYSNLFPTFYASYKLDTTDKHQLNFSYGRRIDRPDYQSMNPFTYPMDRFTLYGGNPFLRPTYSGNFELSHTYKNNFTTTIEYSKSKDEIRETIEQGTNIFYSRPGNIGQTTSYAISISGALQPTKWWTLQLFGLAQHIRSVSQLYGQSLNNKGTLYYLSPTSMFTINKLWNAELAAVYQSSAYVGQFVTIPVWNMRMAASRKVLKEKGTLKFSLSDIFYTNQPGGDIKSIANSSANWLSYLDTRVATISFSWRFNKGQSLKARQSGGSESEQKRVKS